LKLFGEQFSRRVGKFLDGLKAVYCGGFEKIYFLGVFE
jgi:hypothetical protein